MQTFERLTNPIKALFGGGKSAAQSSVVLTDWLDWFEPVSIVAPMGIDLTYDDDFLLVKEEVARSSDVDNAFIVQTSERLIKTVSKDVRVAVYYVYGRAGEHGAEGLAAGLELLAGLVERFGATLLPARSASRRAAFEWLCGATFATRLDRLQGGHGGEFERAAAALARVMQVTDAWPEASRPALSPLLRCLENRAASEALLAAATANAVDVGAEPNQPAESEAPADRRLSSNRELLEQARAMARFLKEQPSGHPAALRLIRCVRWDALTELPPHDASGQTRIAGPRADLRRRLSQLMLCEQWDELLGAAEAAFCESSNHLWLDLQYYLFVAQQRVGGVHAAASAATAADCALLLDRVPGIEYLSFADGTPFASGATLEWIEQHAESGNLVDEFDLDLEPIREAPAIAADWVGIDWAEVEQGAVDIASRQGLKAALSWLQQPAMSGTEEAGGERVRFMSRMVMARVCERIGRSDMAMQLLSALDLSVQRFELDCWEPSLAFAVKQQMLRILRSGIPRQEMDRNVRAARIEALSAELIAIDAARAVALA